MSNNFEVNQKVNNELAKYVFDCMPSDLNSNLEKSIAIYVILCRVLKYDARYFIFNDLDKVSSVNDITISNNEVMFMQFAEIYSQLLTMVGISNKVNGNPNTHMFVSFNCDGMFITVDPTKSGYCFDDYYMSDFTNVRFGYLLNGFRAMPFSMEIDKISIVCDYLRENIINVYNKLNINFDAGYRINEVLNKIYSREKDRSVLYNGDRINRMVDSINCVPMLNDCEVENIELLNKLTSNLFRDVLSERFECVILYNESLGKVRIAKLLVVYDEQLLPYYTLLIDGKLVRMNVGQLYEYMVREGWFFKYEHDVGTLNIDDKELNNKLCKLKKDVLI